MNDHLGLPVPPLSRKGIKLLTQFFTEVDACIECLDGEVYSAVDEPEVRQLDLQGLVHWGEVDQSICCNVVLVHRPPGSK